MERSAPPIAAEAYAATLANQRSAAEPGLSAWVGASAGSGKTKVLSDRVLRLLLAGNEPQRLLCLTFTRAAAAEMAKRVAARLADWTAADPADLQKSLIELLDRLPSPEELQGARNLFAKMLDAPGGLKIQTIHSFCQSILARFPLEAGITPNFEAMDERSAAELLARAREEVLESIYIAKEGGATELRPALHRLAAELSEQDFATLLSDLTAEHDRVRRMVEGFGGLENAISELYRGLGLESGETEAALLEQSEKADGFDPAQLRRLAEHLSRGAKSDRDRGALIAEWLATARNSLAAAYRYAEAFLTRNGEPRKHLMTKALAEARPDLLPVAEAECERLRRLFSRLAALKEARQTEDMLRLGWRVTEAYQRAKRAAVALDYDDMILLVRGLLQREGIAAWVHYKLDGGIDHVLVDEAQDTSPAQWQVIGSLTDEFFSGEGAAEAHRDPGRPPRSLFVVGDPKQSIFGFQGAAPELFSRMRERYQRKARDAQKAFRSLPLDMSFRSTQAVLDAVDAVFSQPGMERGVNFGESWRRHRAHRAGAAGQVELWPPVEPEEEPPLDPWEPPLGPEERLLPRSRLAKLIAAKIHYWTQRTEAEEDPDAWLPARARRMLPGDFMVLVQRRNAFVSELVRALKAYNVPVAGVDRMRLLEQLPVMDLVAFGKFQLLPEDDLTLAAVLRGPLVDLPDETLERLCWEREGSLWNELKRAAAEDAVTAKAYDFLSAQLAKADYLDAYELYQDLLSAQGGRERILARLGSEANDPLDEFLALTLEYSGRQAPSLQGFLHWLAADGREIKRDLEQAEGVVRILTVHAAKGLQAPVVILPDTFGSDRNDRKLLWREGESEAANAPPFCLFPGSSGQRSGLSEELRNLQQEAELQERRRLLYVAMTRAEDRLIVCGYKGKRNQRAEPWYDLVETGLRALDPSPREVEFDFTGLLPDGGWRGKGVVLTSRQQAPQQEKAQPARRPSSESLPEWANTPPEPEPTPSRPLAPSRPSGPEPASLSPLAGDESYRFKRGLLVHRLLQSLPDLPREARRERGLAFLRQPSLGLTRKKAEALLEETLAVLQSADFGAVFGPGSRAEVPLVGLVNKRRGGQETISGQIDRLLIAEEEILVVDFKTNRPAAESESQVPAAYLRQMASYRALLQKIYPGRKLRCALLWTEGPRLMTLSDKALDQHAP